jgi:hypothetical protein
VLGLLVAPRGGWAIWVGETGAAAAMGLGARVSREVVGDGYRG